MYIELDVQTCYKFSVLIHADTIYILLFISLLITRSFLVGPNMLNSHHMQANGDMNGGHSSQSILSASHCSPPPPYNPDPNFVRYLTLQWHSF